MNRGLKAIVKALEELELNYEVLEDDNCIVTPLRLTDIGISLNFVIGLTEVGDRLFSVFIMSGPITTVNNENELYKAINKINSEYFNIKYYIGGDGVKCSSYSVLAYEDLEDIVIILLRLMDENICENYSSLMKSNWS